MKRRCYTAILALGCGVLAASSAAAQGTITYKYDDQGRLVSSRYPNGATTTYSYDAVDNRTRLKMSFTNQAPIAADDSVDVFPVATKNVYVLANDSDPNNDALTITASGTGTKGFTGIVGGNHIQYTSITGQSGADSFTYTISDGTATATGTVRVNISALPPTTANSSFNVTQNSTNNTATLSLGGGTATNLYVDQQAKFGSAYVSGSTILYTPIAGFQGNDSFTYSAANAGGRSVPATISVLVGTAPAAPTASATSATVPLNTITTFPLNVAGNYSSVEITSNPSASYGQVTVNGKNATFSPKLGVSGPTSFGFRAVGPGGVSSNATASVTISSATGSAAGASTASITTTKNVPATLALPTTGVVSQIYIYPGGPSHGSLAVNGTSVTYTPATDYVGSDSFNYQALGPGGQSGGPLVSITVNAPALAAPTASNSSVVVDRNSTNNVVPLSLGGGAATGITVVTGPATGTLSITGAQAKYTPTANQNAADSFIYKATNSAGQSANATVTVNVNGASASPPSLVDYYVTVASNSSDNVFLPHGSNDSTSVQILREPSHGTRTIQASAVRYTPTPGYFGPDSYEYTASNSGGVSNKVTLYITVSPPAPSVHADGMSVPYNVPTAKIMPVSGPYTSVQAVAAPAHGSVAFSGNTVTFTPTTNYSGADAFTYRAIGPGGTGAAERVDVIVGQPFASNNIAPTAASNSVQVAATETAINVLGNDSDPNGDALTIISLSSYNTGWASYRIDGPNIYVKPGSVNTTDYITYTVSDGRGGVASATLTSFLKPN